MPPHMPTQQHMDNDLGPEGDRTGRTVMYMHPKTYLWIHEQERERMFAQAALERAARSGREPGPGLIKGAISGLAHAVRRAASAAGGFRLGGSRPSSSLTGSTGG
jgi:hypothetical protein